MAANFRARARSSVAARGLSWVVALTQTKQAIGDVSTTIATCVDQALAILTSLEQTALPNSHLADLRPSAFYEG